MGAIFGLPAYLEVAVVLLVALLLFGNRLPGVARSLAQGIIEFRKGLKGGDDKRTLPGKGKPEEDEEER